MRNSNVSIGMRLGRNLVLGIASGILFFGGLSVFPALFAADSNFSTPTWRTNGGERVLLAATTTQKKQSSRNRIRRPSRDFDHLLTGFPLFGAHVNVDCGDCHLHGILRGTPTRCDQCHGNPGQRASSVKPANHITTQAPCDQCHNENIWAGSRFDHSAIAPTTCGQCHNGGKAMGKPGGHISTTLSCDSCHRTTGWIPAAFKHGNVAPGSCGTCHGVTATGKPAGHVTTALACDSCHATTGWIPARFNHSGVAPGTCTTCHGVTASGKPSGHMVTTESCDACHTTTAWLPATSGHGASGPTPGTCNNCHLKDIPGGHFVLASPRSCDQCHADTRWLPLVNYAHTSVFFPGQHNSKVTCNSCHNNTEVLVWPNVTDKAFCGGCHKKDYQTGPHLKYETPETKYSYEELKDCTTSCHAYKSAIDSTIVKNRPGRHTPGAGGF